MWYPSYMKSVTHIQLTISEDLSARLSRLQAEFARACNYVAPIAKANHCWNRVTLHHLSYRQVREHFPELGSQMACNAIYSVCRSYRLLLSHPQSPFFGKKIKEGDLPQIAFLPHSPVFFDRHTLSLQKSTLSLFTLEGRLRFGIALSAEDEQRFRSEKLREIQLLGQGGQYRMSLYFDAAEPAQSADSESPWPDYVVLTDLVAGDPHIQADSANAAITSAPLKQAS
jgi:hypothetical protein